MTPKGRRAVRIAIFGFAVMFGLLFGVAAVGATRDVVGADPGTHSILLIAAIGAWLKVLGTVGLYVCTAVGFRDWPTFALPFTPAFGSLGPRRELRRAQRQIDGKESYAASEIPRLQLVARYRLALAAHSTDRTIQAGSISLILIFVGQLLQPLDLGVVLGRVFQGLAIAMIVVLLVSLPFTRRRTDEKALLFLAQSAGEQKPESAR